MDNKFGKTASGLVAAIEVVASPFPFQRVPNNDDVLDLIPYDIPPIVLWKAGKGSQYRVAVRSSARMLAESLQIRLYRDESTLNDSFDWVVLDAHIVESGAFWTKHYYKRGVRYPPRIESLPGCVVFT